MKKIGASEKTSENAIEKTSENTSEFIRIIGLQNYVIGIAFRYF